MSDDMQEKDRLMKARLKLMYPTEDDLLDAIMTMLGMSATLTMFLGTALESEVDLPFDVKYAMVITSANMRSLYRLQNDTEFEKVKYPLLEIASEQHEEIMDRRIISIIKMLYQDILEDEKI